MVLVPTSLKMCKDHKVHVYFLIYLNALKNIYDIIQRRVLGRRTYDLLTYGTCKQFYIYNKTISIDYNVFSIIAYNIIFIYTKSNYSE